MTDTSRITVLLALYDGCAHLEAQMQSYLDQTRVPARVLASDDHPGDGTAEHFLAFTKTEAAAAIGDWELIPGPGRGPTANFLHLLRSVDAEGTDFVALSDQDDIWLPDKLDSAVTRIASHGERPVLLGTRSWEWHPSRDLRKLSRQVPEPWDFSHALVQNYAGGNTMVMNRAALKLVQTALALGGPCPAVHDWWLYQLISGAGGIVILDPTPRLLYRQHPGNQIGANSSIPSKALRFWMMLYGTYRLWMSQNLATLTVQQDLLTSESRALLHRLAQDRNGSLITRLRLLAQTPLHRKGWPNQLTLWIAAVLQRM
ncbi:glycosyltransferase [Tritonibacter scottomollicae]|uniref:glycosyltransferase n=1 Tax=Tritonibacter scottomollicae TaxID=483013 RepID=UPI003AA921AD